MTSGQRTRTASQRGLPLDSTWTDTAGNDIQDTTVIDMKVANGGNTAQRIRTRTEPFSYYDDLLTLAVNSDTKITATAEGFGTAQIFRNGNLRYYSSSDDVMPASSFGIFNKATTPAVLQHVGSWRWAGDNERVINEILTALENYGWLQ